MKKLGRYDKKFAQIWNAIVIPMLRTVLPYVVLVVIRFLQKWTIL